MPDEYGNVKGSGWTRKRAEGWERVFGSKPKGCSDCPFGRNPHFCDVTACDSATQRR